MTSPKADNADNAGTPGLANNSRTPRGEVAQRGGGGGSFHGFGFTPRGNNTSVLSLYVSQTVDTVALGLPKSAGPALGSGMPRWVAKAGQLSPMNSCQAKQLSVA